MDDNWIENKGNLPEFETENVEVKWWDGEVESWSVSEVIRWDWGLDHPFDGRVRAWRAIND